MPFKIVEFDPKTTTKADLKALVEVEWLSYSHPPNPLLPLLFPILDSSPAARTSAFEESIERQLAWLKDDPAAHWIQAVDSDSGDVVGAALTYFCKKNPFEKEGNGEEEVECTWYPEGEGREIANSLMGQFLRPRMKYMARPHAFLNILFTHPSHRRRGVGKLLMACVLERADAMGLETYIDATEQGVPLYESCGFVKGDRVDFVADQKEKGVKWRELEGVLMPFSWWPMWRASGGRDEEGRKAPWAEM